MRFLLLFAILSCARTEAAPVRRIALEPCRLKGTGLQAQCGKLRVPEDRKKPAGRQLDLRIAVVPALAREPAPDPLFLLAGGPGQAATEALGPLLGAFERIHRTRDLVLVDQRGTGSSHALRCDLHDDDAPLAERLKGDALTEEKFKKCLAGYDADVRFYTTSIAMQDLDEVREALGYQSINLWGGSYGTRAGLIYLREHGEHARAVVLDGVAPLSLKLPANFAADAQRSMDLLFKHCADDAACAKAFPELQKRFEKLLADLDAHPARAHVLDPLNGQPGDVTIPRDIFTSGLRGALYQQDIASLIPLIVDRAARGDFAPYVAASASMDQGFARTMSLGLLFSIVCAEDLPFVQPGQIEAEAKGTFLGPKLAKDFDHICTFWPRGEVPPHWTDAVASNKPVLLLSGELDPVTPPHWADDARKTLSNSRHLVVPGVGHGASAEGCVPQLIAKFIDAPQLDQLDDSCLKPLHRPPFFVTFAGPTP